MKDNRNINTLKKSELLKEIAELRDLLEAKNREIETLKSDKLFENSLSIHEAIIDSIIKIYDSSDINHLIETLNSTISNLLKIIECNIFKSSENGTLVEISNNDAESNLSKKIKLMEEEGITDWVMSQKVPRIMSDLEAPQTSKIKIIVLPLYLGNRSYGILAILSSDNLEKINSISKELIIIAEYAAVSLETKQYIDQISLLNQKLNNINEDTKILNHNKSLVLLSSMIYDEIEKHNNLIKSNLELINSYVGDPTIRTKIISNQLQEIDNLRNFYKLNYLSVKNDILDNLSLIDILQLISNALKSKINSSEVKLNFNFNSDVRIIYNRNLLTGILMNCILFLTKRISKEDAIIINANQKESSQEINFKFTVNPFSFKEIDYFIQNTIFDNEFEYLNKAQNIFLKINDRIELESDTKSFSIIRIILNAS